MTSVQTETPSTDKKHFCVSMLLLGGLIFLRFPFLTGLAIVLPDQSNYNGVIFFTFAIGTYLLSAFLIWWERKSLHDFWIDIASAITFLCQIFCFPIGIGLFYIMGKARASFPAVPSGTFRWGILGAILALLSNIFIFSMGLHPASATRSTNSASLFSLFPAVLIQMTNAGVWEEPLFRGFLWGYLRRWRWPNIWIWIFQAMLFTLGHVYYLRQEAFFPWLVRLMIPSLIIGLIAWQARSIFASMITHGMINASGDMLLHTSSSSEAIQVCWLAILVLALLWVILWVLSRRRFGWKIPSETP